MNLVTPFASTLGSGTDDLVDGVKDIFVAEIVTSSLIKFIDPVGLFKRHYLAPRAKSQEEMNSYMRGEVWYLAERFTNMSKREFSLPKYVLLRVIVISPNSLLFYISVFLDCVVLFHLSIRILHVRSVTAHQHFR